jgi:hypothetical protein
MIVCKLQKNVIVKYTLCEQPEQILGKQVMAIAFSLRAGVRATKCDIPAVGSFTVWVFVRVPATQAGGVARYAHAMSNDSPDYRATLPGIYPQR